MTSAMHLSMSVTFNLFRCRTRCRRRKPPIRCGLVLIAAMSSSAGAVETILRADWTEVRQGQQLTRMPALQRLMARFERLDDPQIIIRYPGGDLGNAWAVELRDWLVAMGVSSRRIALEPGSGAPAAMTVDVRDRGRR